jgi:hypothetical protein
METPQIPPEESVTFSIKKSSRNSFFAKMIILLILTLVGGYFFAQEGTRQYEKGRELTQEKYLERFDEYKGALLNRKQFENPLLSTITMFIFVSFLIGSYELTVLIIGFLIGKVIRR